MCWILSWTSGRDEGKPWRSPVSLLCNPMYYSLHTRKPKYFLTHESPSSRQLWQIAPIYWQSESRNHKMSHSQNSVVIKQSFFHCREDCMSFCHPIVACILKQDNMIFGDLQARHLLDENEWSKQERPMFLPSVSAKYPLEILEPNIKSLEIFYSFLMLIVCSMVDSLFFESRICIRNQFQVTAKCIIRSSLRNGINPLYSGKNRKFELWSKRPEPGRSCDNVIPQTQILFILNDSLTTVVSVSFRRDRFQAYSVTMTPARLSYVVISYSIGSYVAIIWSRFTQQGIICEWTKIKRLWSF